MDSKQLHIEKLAESARQFTGEHGQLRRDLDDLIVAVKKEGKTTGKQYRRLGRWATGQ